MTYFHMAIATLSSALSSFTSEFEMGSGGSRSLLSPGKPFSDARSRASLKSSIGKVLRFVHFVRQLY